MPGKYGLRTLESISNKREWKKWNNSLEPCSNNQPSYRSVWEAHPHTFSQRRHFIPAPSGVETTPVFPRHHALFPRTAKSKARWKPLSLNARRKTTWTEVLWGNTVLKYPLKCFRAINKRKKLHYRIYYQSKLLLICCFVHLWFSAIHISRMKCNFHKCFTEFKKDRSLNLPNIINKC